MNASVHYVKRVDVHHQLENTHATEFTMMEEGEFTKGSRVTAYVMWEDLPGFIASLEEAIPILREKLPVQHKGSWRECKHSDCIAVISAEHSYPCKPCATIQKHYDGIDHIAE